MRVRYGLISTIAFLSSHFIFLLAYCLIYLSTCLSDEGRHLRGGNGGFRLAVRRNEALIESLSGMNLDSLLYHRCLERRDADPRCNFPALMQQSQRAMDQVARPSMPGCIAEKCALLPA